MRFTLGATLLATAGIVNAIPTITTKGSKFFTSEGNQYFLKGIAYQLVPDDPLIDNTQCQLDAALMRDIGANAIRVYHVDPEADHTSCMATFADAGIYLWLDLDTFDTQIIQTAPQWNRSQYEAFQRVLDAFIQFDNLGGVYVGNEVLTSGAGSVAAPFVKAAVRDLKAYRDSRGYRRVPIGYSAADIATLRPMLQNYLACGEPEEALDFFALNAYEWCGQSTFEQSGYVWLNEQVKDYPVPIYFSETGCNTPKPRLFDDQQAILGPQMTPWWSGAIIYEWIQETNDYGLIRYGDWVDPSSPNAPPDGFPRSGTPIPVLPDFPNLSKHWATLSPTGVQEAEYSPTLTPPSCPEYTAGFWEVNASAGLPTIGQTHVPTDGSSTGATATTSSRRSSSTDASSTHANDAQNTEGANADAGDPPTGGAGAGKEIRRMAYGLTAVMLGFFWWM